MYGFLAETKLGDDGRYEVKLDPEEHQDFVWATEEDVKMSRVGDKALAFVNEGRRQHILQAFEVNRNVQQKQQQ
jgi:hypothetical protein